jgi:diketogulonate reductase-like aldo/keto reductase
MASATLQVSSAISQILPQLPSSTQLNVRRMDATVFPIIAYSLTSPTQSLVQLNDLAQYQRPIARRHGTTVSAAAVAWTLAWPGMTGAIVGARSPAQVDGWIRAATLKLTPADLDEIAAATARTGAGAGPARPTDRRARGGVTK